MKLTRKHLALVLLALCLAIVTVCALLAADILHIWEDGSWALGQYPYTLKGCLPGGLCNY